MSTINIKQDVKNKAKRAFQETFMPYLSTSQANLYLPKDRANAIYRRLFETDDTRTTIERPDFHGFFVYTRYPSVDQNKGCILKEESVIYDLELNCTIALVSVLKRDDQNTLVCLGSGIAIDY